MQMTPHPQLSDASLGPGSGSCPSREPDQGWGVSGLGVGGPCPEPFMQMTSPTLCYTVGA